MNLLNTPLLKNIIFYNLLSSLLLFYYHFLLYIINQLSLLLLFFIILLSTPPHCSVHGVCRPNIRLHLLVHLRSESETLPQLTMARSIYPLLWGFVLLRLAFASQPYENICANPTHYKGGALYNSHNCSTYIGMLSLGTWTNVNWTTVTCSDLSESGTFNLLNSLGQVCCGGKPTICTPDYSKVCKNTSNYNGSATSAVSSMTCDQYIQVYSQSGNVFENISWPNATCSDFTASLSWGQPI